MLPHIVRRPRAVRDGLRLDSRPPIPLVPALRLLSQSPGRPEDLQALQKPRRGGLERLQKLCQALQHWNVSRGDADNAARLRDVPDAALCRWVLHLVLDSGCATYTSGVYGRVHRHRVYEVRRAVRRFRWQAGGVWDRVGVTWAITKIQKVAEREGTPTVYSSFYRADVPFMC